MFNQHDVLHDIDLSVSWNVIFLLISIVCIVKYYGQDQRIP
ncbi:hypothetical protein DSUL_20538 [Desulfovibrionales bacterium]